MDEENLLPPPDSEFTEVTFTHCQNALFYNPWPTWREFLGVFPLLRFMSGVDGEPDYKPSVGSTELKTNLPLFKPIFCSEDLRNKFTDQSYPIQLTWLGHATVYCRLDGVGILCDPVFSHRCSATQFLGPARYRPIPCQISEIPEGQIDMVLISHNHYDHMDMNTIAQLGKHHPRAVWCVPKGDKDKVLNHLRKNKPRDMPTDIDVKEFLWWEKATIKTVEVVFTPSQHWSGRNIVLDKNKALWGSWAFKGPQKHTFWFGGDTGYCSVFKEIGQQLGPFDIAAIPIGAYHPREFLQCQHVDPKEAVCIHQDIRAKRTLGMHWGTFALALENYMRPKSDLQKAVEEAKIGPGQFSTINHGQTLLLSAQKLEETIVSGNKIED